MKKTLEANTELLSLNEELHTEFAIQELEQRLETDPLMFVDFFQETMLMDNHCHVAGALNVCEGNSTLNACSKPESLVAEEIFL